MAQQSPRIFFYVCAAIFVLAALFRFSGLGQAPLNEYEAQAALTALDPAGGLGDQPGFTLLTSIVFSLLGGSEWSARLLPALFGLALVALPILWRDRLGDKAAVVLALILALDPGMVALSRLASGRMLAVAGALMAITAWRFHRPIAAGSLATVALLAGGTIYFGLIAALVSWFALRPILALDRGNLRTSAATLLIALVAGGTLLFTIPHGMGGVGLALQGFIASQSWSASPTIVIFALVAYGLPLLVFGGVGALRSWRHGLLEGKFPSFFALAAFTLVLLHPSRQVADLVWVSLPLAILAAQEMSLHLHAPRHEPSAAFGGTGLLLLLSTFLVFTLARVADEAQLVLTIPESAIPWVAPGLWIALFVLLVVGVVIVLIALGWSVKAGVQALVWSAALLFLAFIFSASSRFVRPEPLSNELWSPGPAAGTLRLMQATVDDVSFWQQGQYDSVPVDLRRQSAALQWALRELPEFDSAGSPPLAVTSSETNPQEFASYRGQSFALSSQPAWLDWPPNFFAWLLFRDAPIQTDQVILWVSPDLFIDGAD